MCQIPQSLKDFFQPCTGPIPVCPIVLYWGAQHWKQCSKCVSSAEQCGRITSLLLAVFFLMQPMLLLSFFAAKAHCWLMFNSMSSRAPDPSLERRFLAGWHLPSPPLWFYIPQMQEFELLFLELLDIPVGPFLQPAEAPLNNGAPIWFIDTSLQFCITLLRICRLP